MGIIIQSHRSTGVDICQNVRSQAWLPPSQALYVECWLGLFVQLYAVLVQEGIQCNKLYVRAATPLHQYTMHSKNCPSVSQVINYDLYFSNKQNGIHNVIAFIQLLFLRNGTMIYRIGHSFRFKYTWPDLHSWLVLGKQTIGNEWCMNFCQEWEKYLVVYARGTHLGCARVVFWTHMSPPTHARMCDRILRIMYEGRISHYINSPHAMVLSYLRTKRKWLQERFRGSTCVSDNPKASVIVPLH